MKSRVPAALLVVLLTATACDLPFGDSGPDPDPTVDDLAAALAARDLAGVPLAVGSAQAATTELAEITEDLSDIQPAVEVGDVTEGDDGTATATLTWSWPVVEGGDAWTYDVEAELTETGGEWQVVWSPALVEPSLVEGERLRVSRTTPQRGDITGARGEVVVTERPVLRIGLDKPQVPEGGVAASARSLARLVGVDAADLVARAEAAGPKAFVEAITFRRDDVPPEVESGLAAIPGGRAIGGYLALAPTKDFAAPILGRVGEVTAEMVEEQPETYRPGDIAGVSGLQARYDERLRGTPGVDVEAVSGSAEEPGAARMLWQVEAVDGEPLALSLYVRLQNRAEQALAGIGPGSALVAVRPSTGEIVAAANGPGNDGQNLATYGRFAPGSTFKSVSALALLRAGLTPESVVSCPSRLVVDGKPFKNYSDYPASALGRIPLRTAVANSCNTAFISQSGKVEGTALYDAAVSLGLGLDHDLGFPAYFGSVEPPTSETGAAAALIGQGTVLASPMVMATVIASVQRGELVVPRMVEGVESTKPEGAKPLSRKEATALRAMLRAVVTEGSGRGLADLPGPPVIAKTGTAEFGTGPDLQTHAWMIAAQGDLAVAVFVDVGESGSQTAGPVLEAFLRAAR
ncbi:penicillin-binding transpeptidase domain-containing protein [Nocardioides sp. SYSU D00038]|uniref:penicillin-binding transpeptidase domain-containing protein n=1 Tax=Nocardioides sp. SYSU D00038 TaxID=2812554 RepID=UPI001967E714|nr:penicillin-binding transpeptidase domain-containing protein [Nocardioides sp. SYSU D00038]